MTQPADRFQSRLKRDNQSLTQARQTVFHALLDHGPLRMHELIDECGGIDRASVYRTVRLFEELGIVQRLQLGWKHRFELTDQYVDHHHHASCLHCGRIVPLPERPELERSLDRLALAVGFQPSGHQLEIRGLCADCSVTLLPRPSVDAPDAS